METIDLLLNGKIVANVVTRKELPKKAIIVFFDYLNVEDSAFTNVAVYARRTKKYTTYYAIIKDERLKKDDWLENNKQ